MFRCQLCGALVPPRTPGHRLVVETRKAVYPFRSRANFRFVRKTADGKRQKKENRYTDDPGGCGAEIVREVTACPNCAAAVSRRK